MDSNLIERIVVIENSLKYLGERIIQLEDRLDILEKESIGEIKRVIQELEKLIVELREKIVEKEVIDKFRSQEAVNNANEHAKIQNEIDSLKRFAWLAVGIFVTLQFLIPILIDFFRR